MKLIDLTGQRFGRIVVIEKADSKVTPNGTVKTVWRCRCDCGNVVERYSQDLRKVPVPSCGCLKREETSRRKLIDLTGRRFGKLVVIERAENVGKRIKWKCQCDCGKQTVVYGENLVKGHTTSCGCYRDDMRGKLHHKHGMKHARIYTVWCKVKDRCYQPSNSSYPRYGGRGITMCDEWRDDPMSFINWSYENGYDENAGYGECTLDRIDNSKGYCPENCRWVDEKTQANNRRSNLLIAHNGETKTLAQWRDHFGMTQSKAYYHLVTKGRSIQELIDKGIV